MLKNKENKKKTRILYLTYDGIFDPLGQSQILPYLINISKEYKVHLVSFEKNMNLINKNNNYIFDLIKKNNFFWIKIRYSKNSFTRIFYLFYSLVIISYLIFFKKIRILHLRSYISALIVWPFTKICRLKIIFDMRGFWPEEKVDRSSWKTTDIKYKFFKKIEKYFLTISKSIVCLTSHAKRIIIDRDSLLNPSKITVIPTCADNNIFFHKKKNINNKITFCYIGTTHSAYDIEKVLKLMSNLKNENIDIYLTIYTNDSLKKLKEKISKFNNISNFISIKSLGRMQINDAISETDYGIFYLNKNNSIKASFPTKIAEYLLCGKPIICNNFNDDINDVININKIGLIHNFSIENISDIKSFILNSKNDIKISSRCINFANNNLELEIATKKYLKVYEEASL
jgi:hypothetical protein